MSRTLSVPAIMATAALALMVTATAAHADGARSENSVSVVGGAQGITVNRHVVEAGRVTFKVTTTNAQLGSVILLFKPVAGAPTAKLIADFGEESSSTPAIAAKGTRDLGRDFTFLGVASIEVGTPATVAQTLSAGRYYLVDGQADVPQFTSLWVRRSDDTPARTRSEDSEEHHHYATVSMTRQDRFASRRILPAHGIITVNNRGDSIHQLDMLRVKPGTTDAQVQAYLESPAFAQGEPASFDMAGPAIGVPLLSPGRQMQLSYSLPRGTYVLVCRIADDQTGMLHLVMGMHKVVRLR